MIFFDPNNLLNNENSQRYIEVYYTESIPMFDICILDDTLTTAMNTMTIIIDAVFVFGFVVLMTSIFVFWCSIIAPLPDLQILCIWGKNIAISLCKAFIQSKIV